MEISNMTEFDLYDIVLKYSNEETAKKVVKSAKAMAANEAANQMKEIKVEIIDRIHQSKVDMIKWYVGIGVVQFLAIVASLIGILSFMLSHMKIS